MFQDIIRSFRKENRGSGRYKKYLSVLFFCIIAITVTFAFLQTAKTVREIKVDDAISVADSLLETGDYSAAESIYLDYARDPVFGKAAKERLVALYTSRTNELLKQGASAEEVLFYLDKLLYYTPEDADALFAAASMRKDIGDYASSSELCERILKLRPDDDSTIRLYADLLLKTEDNKAVVEFLNGKADELGIEGYRELAKTLYPVPPEFSHEDGTYQNYFMLSVRYIPFVPTQIEAQPITADRVTILYTLDGSLPDPSVITTAVTDQTANHTFIYDGGIDMEYYGNGSTMTVTAVAVADNGMVSDPAVGVFTFDTEYKPVKRLTLTHTETKMEEDETILLRVEISPSTATNQNIIWTSSDTSFAVVDSLGTVTAVHFTDNTDLGIRTERAKTVEITATAAGDGVTATCTVTVVPARIPANTLYHYVRDTAGTITRKFASYDLTADKEFNPDTVAYLYMDDVNRVPFLPNGLVYSSTEESDYSLRAADGTEDGIGEIYLYPGCTLEPIGRNTIICSNYVEISLPEMKEPLPEMMSEEEATAVAQRREEEEAALAAEMEALIAEAYARGEEPDPELLPEPPAPIKPLLTAIASLDEHPVWYLDGTNHYVYLVTSKATYIFQLFSWYKPEETFTEYLKTDFKNRNELITFCNTVEDAGQMYNTASPKFDGDSRVLTLIVYREGKADTVAHFRLARWKTFNDYDDALADDGIYEPVGKTPEEVPETEQETETEPNDVPREETPADGPESPSDIPPEEPLTEDPSSSEEKDNSSTTGFERIEVPEDWGDPALYDPYYKGESEPDGADVEESGTNSSETNADENEKNENQEAGNSTENEEEPISEASSAEVQ